MNESRVFRDKIDFKIIYHRNQKMLEESYLIHLVSSGKDMASMMSSLTPFRKNRGKNTKEKRNDPDSARKAYWCSPGYTRAVLRGCDGTGGGANTE